MLLLLIIIIIILIGLERIVDKNYNLLALCRRIKRVDGNPLFGVYPGRTIFGNNFDHYGCNGPDVLFKSVRNMNKNAQTLYFQYVIGVPQWNIVNPEDTEEIFNSMSLIKKGVTYELLHEFIQEGLLTSTNEKWQQRRKLLTPSFHFNILQRFMETFKSETLKFLAIIEKHSYDALNLTKTIPKFTLNNICETALGIDLDNIQESEEYRENIVKVEKHMIRRICNPFLFLNFINNLTTGRQEYKNIVKQLHDFSSKIINRKRINFQSKDGKLDNDTNEDVDDIYYFKKGRYAMLDNLLDAENKNLITHKGICEEVDTFMFEGFDTTSSCLIFTIMCLALNEDVQKQCYEEMLLQLPDDLSTLTITQLNNLKYLECAIKESLRLYPPVPFISRGLEHDTTIRNFIFPKGTTINIHIFDIHRDPRHFPNPDVYDPSRFLPENSISRHPYCFIPFSAGARNCIGQKFAMLEVKTLIVHLIKKYEILPVTKVEDIIFESGMVLRSKNQIKVRLRVRAKTKN